MTGNGSLGFEEVRFISYIAGIIGVGIANILGFLATRTVKKIDANQDKLFNKIDQHETRLSRLEGEHRVMAGHKKFLICEEEEDYS
jgi:hypothetical protein